MPAFLAPYALKLAMFGAAVMAVLAAILGVYEKGKHAQRMDDLEGAYNALQTRNKVEQELAAGGDAERKRVRDAYSRD